VAEFGRFRDCSCRRVENELKTIKLTLEILWNSLPKQLRQPSAPPSLGAATDSTPLRALSSHQFHFKLKTFLFEQILS